MARTRIIIGHPAASGGAPHVVYVGSSGSEAEAAMKADTAAHHYEIFEGPGRRKNNSSYIAPEAPKVGGAPKALKAAKGPKAGKAAKGSGSEGSGSDDGESSEGGE